MLTVSGHYMSFIFKTCQIVACASMIRQFHEFFNLIFGGFLTFGTTVRWGAKPTPAMTEGVRGLEVSVIF